LHIYLPLHLTILLLKQLNASLNIKLKHDIFVQAQANLSPYDMGSGGDAKTPEEAMEKFLKREFPDLLEAKDGSHHPVRFIPDSFIYGKVAEMVT